MIFGYFMHMLDSFQFFFIASTQEAENMLIDNEWALHCIFIFRSVLRHMFENLIKLFLLRLFILSCNIFLSLFIVVHCNLTNWANSFGVFFLEIQASKWKTFIVDKYKVQLWYYIKFITSIINVCVFVFFLGLAFQQMPSLIVCFCTIHSHLVLPNPNWIEH